MKIVEGISLYQEEKIYYKSIFFECLDAKNESSTMQKLRVLRVIELLQRDTPQTLTWAFAYIRKDE